MRTVTRSTGHSRQEALAVGETLTISANPDRTLLALAQLGTKTELTITVGSGDPIVVASGASESIGSILGLSDIVLTSQVVITTDTNTTITAILSDPNALTIA